jgi:flagellar hook-length control protein FliK
MTTDGLPVEPSPVSDGPQGHDASLLSPSTQPVKTTVARMTINPTAISPSAPFAATEPVVALEEPVKVRMSPDTSQIAAEKVDPFASGSKTQPVSGTSAPNLATILPENVSELPTPSAAGPMMAQLRQTLDTRDAAWRERLVTQVIGDARDGAQSVKITLRPKSLGDIQLNIEISRYETTVRIITETASAARLLLANEDLLSHLMDQSGVRLTSMTAQAAALTGWLGQANGQSTSQNSGGQSGRDGAGGRKDRARGAEAARAEPAATLKLGDSSQLSINLMA